MRADLKTPTFVTTDTIYLRFIGDKVTEKKNIGLDLREKESELKEYVDHIKNTKEDHNIEDIIVTFNNNYSGFGPQLAGEFSRLMYEPK